MQRGSGEAVRAILALLGHRRLQTLIPDLLHTLGLGRFGSQLSLARPMQVLRGLLLEGASELVQLVL